MSEALEGTEGKVWGSEKKKKKSGDPADNTPPWEYFQLLQFLKEFVKHRRTAGNVDLPVVVADEEEETSDREREEQEDDVLDSSADVVSVESSSRPATPSSLAHTSKWTKPSKRHKRDASDAIDAEILRQHGSVKDLPQECSKDEDSLFGECIAALLKRMDPQKKSLAKIRIQQVLYDVDFSPPFPKQPHLSPSPSFPPFPTNFASSENSNNV